MDFIFILLGVLIILSLFNVGSFVYKKLKINHFVISAFLLVLLLLLFVPNIKINNVSLSIAGFIVPIVISLKLLPKLKSKRRVSSFIVSVLLTITAVLVYNLIDFSMFEYSLIKPYMPLSIVLGLVTYLICRRSSISYLSLLYGITLGQVIFYQIKFSGEILVLGSQEILTALIISTLTSLICEGIYGLYVKNKRTRYEKKLERLKTIEK